MSFSHRHSTEPGCWGDDRAREEDPQPAKAFFYWNGSCNIKEKESGCVRKQEKLHPKHLNKHNLKLLLIFPHKQMCVSFTFRKKHTNKMKQHVATLIMIIKK